MYWTWCHIYFIYLVCSYRRRRLAYCITHFLFQWKNEKFYLKFIFLSRRYKPCHSYCHIGKFYFWLNKLIISLVKLLPLSNAYWWKFCWLFLLLMFYYPTCVIKKSKMNFFDFFNCFKQTLCPCNCIIFTYLVLLV